MTGRSTGMEQFLRYRGSLLVISDIIIFILIIIITMDILIIIQITIIDIRIVVL